jgi:alcohol dehydrogenase
MARPLGAYFQVPHGIANALLLTAVTAYSLPAAPARYAELAVALRQDAAGAAGAGEGATAGGDLLAALRELCAALQVPRLRDFGVSEADLRRVAAAMAADALASGSPANNPRVPAADEIVRLYEEVY